MVIVFDTAFPVNVSVPDVVPPKSLPMFAVLPHVASTPVTVDGTDTVVAPGAPESVTGTFTVHAPALPSTIATPPTPTATPLPGSSLRIVPVPMLLPST